MNVEREDWESLAGSLTEFGIFNIDMETFLQKTT